MKQIPTLPKKNDLSLERKIKAYSVAALAMVAAQPAAGAIVYTDIIPDASISGSSGVLDLDLNNDAIRDFTLSYVVNTMVGYRYAAISPTIGNQVLGSGSNSSFYPFALDLNDTIDGAQNPWRGPLTGTSTGIGILAFVSATSVYGNWLGAVDKYIGLRFKISGKWHYGWVRLDIDNSCNSVVVKDFAYESDADQTILAGAKGGGAGLNGHILSENINIFSSDHIVTVDLKGVSLTNAELILTSINGQEVLSSRIAENFQQFDLGELSSGIYLATIRSKEGVLTRKIYIN